MRVSLPRGGGEVGARGLAAGQRAWRLGCLLAGLCLGLWFHSAFQSSASLHGEPGNQAGLRRLIEAGKPSML